MREKLVSYIDLLFAAAPEATEIKQEILQNTLDRYDDLIEQGQTPEIAYRLAISGIGDINEVLESGFGQSANSPAAQAAPHPALKTRVLRSVGVALYIACVIPLFILQNEIGLCLLLVMVAIATCLMILASSEKNRKETEPSSPSPKQQLRKSVNALVTAITLCVYLGVSFWTHAWELTWLIFPISASIRGIIVASLDLKEAKSHEN